jgi:hypothetical protein
LQASQALVADDLNGLEGYCTRQSSDEVAKPVRLDIE